MQMTRSGIQWRYTLAVMGASVLLIANAGCAGVETAVSAEPGASFTLVPGQTAAIKGTDTRITFRQVREDSRCPVDVTCVWEGDAKIELIISRNGTADETKIVSITPPNNEIRTGNLRIRFVSLAPVPRQADAGTPRKYRGEFVVDQM
jgi:hypothetical protein